MPSYRRLTDSRKGCPYKCYCKINVTGRVTRPLRQKTLKIFIFSTHNSKLITQIFATTPNMIIKFNNVGANLCVRP